MIERGNGRASPKWRWKFSLTAERRVARAEDGRATREGPFASDVAGVEPRTLLP